MAEAIHRRSRRAIAPFIAVNCARLSQACVESKLFGHAPDRAGDIDRGCLELAHGGTIFLAKVDTIGFTLQGRLLDFSRRATSGASASRASTGRSMFA